MSGDDRGPATVSQHWRPRPDGAFATLGLISGIGTTGVAFLVGYGQGPGALADVVPFGKSQSSMAAAHWAGSFWLAYGPIFAMAMAWGAGWYIANPWAALVVLAVVELASIVAGVAFGLVLFLTHGSVGGLLAAGAVGAGITHLGFAIHNRSLRQAKWLALTCCVGAAASLLVYLAPPLLLVIWQPAVAYCIALAGSQPERAPLAGQARQDILN